MLVGISQFYACVRRKPRKGKKDLVGKEYQSLGAWNQNDLSLALQFLPLLCKMTEIEQNGILKKKKKKVMAVRLADR